MIQDRLCPPSGDRTAAVKEPTIATARATIVALLNRRRPVGCWEPGDCGADEAGCVEGRISDPTRVRIGVVIQTFNLFPHLTAVENVVLAPCRVHRYPGTEAQGRPWNCRRCSRRPARCRAGPVLPASHTGSACSFFPCRAKTRLPSVATSQAW